MSTATEIEAAIEKLHSDVFAELAAWVAAQRRAREVKGGDFREAMVRVSMPNVSPPRKELLVSWR